MGLPVAISFLMFFGVSVSMDAEAQDCPACLGGKIQSEAKRDFSKNQHTLHFELSCKVSCHNGMERDVAAKSDFHQFPNVGGNSYPHNFFSIELYLNNQKKCSEVAAPICEKLGGIKSARATRVASGNWSWDYVANPFKCSGNRAQASPFDTDKFVLNADAVPAASLKTQDPNHRYMRGHQGDDQLFPLTIQTSEDGIPNLKITTGCQPAAEGTSPTENQIDVGVCAGCFDKEVGDAVMTSASFGALRCDIENIKSAFESDFNSRKLPATAKLDEARRFCLAQMAHEVKSYAPRNSGCPGYSFDTEVCDALEARIARVPASPDRARENRAPAKQHN